MVPLKNLNKFNFNDYTGQNMKTKNLEMSINVNTYYIIRHVLSANKCTIVTADTVENCFEFEFGKLLTKK